MDIIDYTTIARRRLGLLVGVPLVVALIVLGVTFLSAPEFKSTATVGATTLVGGPENSFNGPQGPNQFTAAFAAMAGMPEVARKVSDSTGVPAPDIRANTEATATGASSQMVISYTSKDRDTVEAVVKGVALEILREIFEPRAKAAENARTIAQQQVDATTALLTEFTKSKGVVDPNASYQAQLSQINALMQQQTNYRANGNSGAASTLEKPLADARKNLATLAQTTADFNSLDARLKAANDDLASAQQSYRRAAAEWAAAQGDDVIYVTKASQVDRLGDLATLLPSAVGAAIFLSALAVLILELLARRRAAATDLDSESPEVPSESEGDGSELES